MRCCCYRGCCGRAWGRTPLHDGRKGCSCRQQITKCVSDTGCGFYRLPEAACCREKQQPASKTNFGIFGCLQLASSCGQLQATKAGRLIHRCDLSEQVKNVMSASMPWHADTESVETDQLDVLHHLASAPDNSTHHDKPLASRNYWGFGRAIVLSLYRALAFVE